MTAVGARRLEVSPVRPRGDPNSASGLRSSGYWVAGVAVFIGALVLFGLGAARGLGTGSGLIVAPILLVLWLTVVRRESRADRGFDAAGIMFLGFGVKMMAAFGRLFMVEEIYGGNGDSLAYHQWGAQLSASFRSFDFAVDPGRPVPGTGFIRLLTGVVYSITGVDRFTGFLIFSSFALIGSYLLFLAFVTAVPDGHAGRFALLVFLWPSLAFWPSSIGKESWMLLGIGMVALGAARLVRHRSGGITLLAIGTLATYMTRPHIAVLLLAATAIGVLSSLLFRANDPMKSLGSVTKLISIGVIVVAGAVLAPGVASFLDIDDVGGSGFIDALERTNLRTSDGQGSTFGGAPIDGPLDYPWALITVIFRPFAWEVGNAQAAVSALEGILLLGLMVASVRTLRQLPSATVRHAYAAMAVGYVFMFCYVFSFIANFGILTRQRVQLLPFLFVLVALPITDTARRRAVSFRARQHLESVESSEAHSGARPGGGINLVTRPLPPPARRR